MRHPHVDPGEVGVCALDAVTDCPHQQPPAVLLLPHERTSAVPLARVLLPVLVAGTEERFPDLLLVAGRVEHVLAAVVIYHGD